MTYYLNCTILCKYIGWLESNILKYKPRLIAGTIARYQRQFDLLVDAADEINDKYKSFNLIVLSSS